MKNSGRSPRSAWSRRSFMAAGLSGAGAAGVLWWRSILPVSPPPPLALKLQYPWYPNGTALGYYAAKENGDYAAAGLDLEIVHGSATIDPVESVMSGNAQFGVGAANLVIQARGDGKPVKAIAAIHQRNPTVFLSLKEKGITRPKDFVGKTIAGARTSVPILVALMSRNGISPNQYKVIHPSNYFEFNMDEADIWISYVFSGKELLEARGLEVNELFPDDYGIHYYRNVIFTTDDMISRQPDTVLRFLRATLKKGWAYAVEHPEEAGEMAARYDSNIDRKHESNIMVRFVPLVATGQVPIGWMTPEIWHAMVDNLAQLRIVDAGLDSTSIYTLDFLKQIYPEMMAR